MRLSRLHGRKACDYLLRKGEVWRGKTMKITWLCGAPRHPQVRPGLMALYVGTFASSHLSKRAVERNRMRRRCREALRTIVKNIAELPTAQLLLTPRSSSLACAFQDIEADVRSFLSVLIRSCPIKSPRVISSSSR